MKGLPRSLAHAKPGNELVPRRVTYPVRDLAITVTGGASTAVGAGTAVLGGLPEGQVLILGAFCSLQFSSDSDEVAADWQGNFAIGSTADDNSTLDGTDVNVIGSTAIGAATAKLSPVVAAVKGGVVLLDNTADDLELNLNMTTADDDVTDSEEAVFTANGYVDVVYIVLGDD